MKDGLVKRILLFALTVVLLTLLIRIARCDDPLGGVPFPRHVEWTAYVVPEGTWTLCKPATDSTEVCIHLTPGTEVYVPRWVTGRSPEDDRARRQRQAMSEKRPSFSDSTMR